MDWLTIAHWLLVPLAVRAIEVTWFDGSLFEAFLNALRVKACQHSSDDEALDTLASAEHDVLEIAVQTPWWSPLVNWCPRLLAELLVCPLCLRRHLAFWLCALLACASFTPDIVQGVVWWMFRVLAVICVADFMDRSRNA